MSVFLAIHKSCMAFEGLIKELALYSQEHSKNFIPDTSNFHFKLSGN